MNSSQSVIQVTDLTRRFGELTAVDHLTLTVERGEIFGLVGPDGAGKTTTLRLICGLLDPTHGQVSVCGLDVARELDSVKDQIGYMAQRFGLYVDLTVEENMIFYGELFGLAVSEREALMSRLLKMTRMEPFRKRAAAKLSGGMKQKLALMCTLLHRPEVLFLDEPTNGVDPISRRDFWAILYQLVEEGTTVVVTTAYLDEAERCNRVGLMHRGQMIQCDAPDALKGAIEEECYKVTTPRLDEVREYLAGRPGVVSVEAFGSELHLFLSPAQASSARLSEDATRRGLGQVQIQRVTPSLEDIFIAMIRKADSGQGKAESGER